MDTYMPFTFFSRTVSACMITAKRVEEIDGCMIIGLTDTHTHTFLYCCNSDGCLTYGQGFRRWEI